MRGRGVKTKQAFNPYLPSWDGFIGPDAVQQRRSFIGLDTVAADPIILIAVSIGCEHILL